MKNPKSKVQFFISLVLVIFPTCASFCALISSNESSRRGLWLSLGNDEYVINGSVDWDLDIISGGNSPEEDSTFLFVEEALFVQASKEAGINLTSLKSLKTADTKKIFSKVFKLLHGNYTCSSIYTNGQRTTEVRNSAGVLINYLENSNFPLKGKGIPKRALEVGLSGYYLHPNEKRIGLTVFSLAVFLFLLKRNHYNKSTVFLFTVFLFLLKKKTIIMK